MPLEALLLETDAPWTRRCKASRGGEHAGQPADHSPLVGTIAAANRWRMLFRCYMNPPGGCSPEIMKLTFD